MTHPRRATPEITEWLARQAWSTAGGRLRLQQHGRRGHARREPDAAQPQGGVRGLLQLVRHDGFLRGGIFAQWGSGVDRSFEDDLKNQPVDGDEDRHAAAPGRAKSTAPTRRWPRCGVAPYRDSWSDLVGTRFWAEGSSGTYRAALARSGVAFYIFGGWEDDFRREGLVAAANLATNPLVRDRAWQHCRNPGFDLLLERTASSTTGSRASPTA